MAKQVITTTGSMGKHDLRIVRLSEKVELPPGADVEVTLTYKIPPRRIEPAAGQLWEHKLSGQRFRLARGELSYQLVDGDTWELVYACRGKSFVDFMSSAEWLNRDCKLIEETP